MGWNLYCQGDNLESNILLQDALSIYKKINNVKQEGQVLKNLAELYYHTNQPKLARQYCEQALKIATKLGIPLAKECQELLSKIEEAENNEI